MRKDFYRKDRGTLKVVLLVALGYFILSSFQSVPVAKSNLEGVWNAHWQMKNPLPGSAPKKTNEMEGLMEFKENGAVKITIYGYKDCIFSNDTLQNELTFNINNDSLTVFNEKEQFHLTYFIQEATKNKISLQLMNDISVTLKKKSNL